jgi:3-deoxy-D-manno-octulosonic-acid transferase
MLPKFKRILLKLSGESLMGDKNFGMDPAVINQYAADIKSIIELGVEVAVVIGGGFGKGLHNSLEIAVYGIPMAFGPNYKKFQEAVDLVKIGVAFPIETFEELSSFLEFCRSENTIPNAGKKYVEEHAGATSAILKGIEKYSA